MWIDREGRCVARRLVAAAVGDAAAIVIMDGWFGARRHRRGCGRWGVRIITSAACRRPRAAVTITGRELATVVLAVGDGTR